MKVFVVVEGDDYEGERLLGIYSSLDKARVAVQLIVNRHNNKQKFKKYHYVTKDNMNWRSNYTYIDIEEHEVL